MTPASPPTPRGLLNLRKPIGVTSRDVVDQVSRPLRKVKVGHAGTLDPLASGVLVVCVGAATRLIQYVQAMPKTYEAVVRLGATSDTLDADGRITERPAPPVPAEADVRRVLAALVGATDQVPPQFSALKLGGRRAYDLARAGLEVELAARPVTIHEIRILGYAWPRLAIEVRCGGGTYIRSIARDAGDALGCGGLIEVLTRTAIGPFAIADALDPAGLDRDAILTQLRPAVEAVRHLPSRTLTAEQLAWVLRGQAIAAAGALEGGEVALIGPDGDLAAIGQADPTTGTIAPRRVLAAG